MDEDRRLYMSQAQISSRAVSFKAWRLGLWSSVVSFLFLLALAAVRVQRQVREGQASTDSRP